MGRWYIVYTALSLILSWHIHTTFKFFLSTLCAWKLSYKYTLVSFPVTMTTYQTKKNWRQAMFTLSQLEGYGVSILAWNSIKESRGSEAHHLNPLHLHTCSHNRRNEDEEIGLHYKSQCHTLNNPLPPMRPTC